jgi:hypothetical protein
MDKRQKVALSTVLMLTVVIGLYGMSTMRDKTTRSITTETEYSIPSNWHFVDAGSFTVSLPPNWKLNKLQGIDSYVAEFTGDGVTLNFDYGWYSSPLVDKDDPSHAITYETIDGKKAKIVIPKEIGSGTTGVYFEDVGDGMNRLQISGDNLTSSQQDVVLKIFRTIQFRKSE